MEFAAIFERSVSVFGIHLAHYPQAIRRVKRYNVGMSKPAVVETLVPLTWERAADFVHAVDDMKGIATDEGLMGYAITIATPDGRVHQLVDADPVSNLTMMGALDMTKQRFAERMSLLQASD